VDDTSYKIRNVAIYLRKSRDEGEYADVLSKHRNTLVSFAEQRGWQYTLYEEIQSAVTIFQRPQMGKLLDDVQDGCYDGVLVMDIDRLGRGNQKEWGMIIEAFLVSNTFIITPQKIYNPADELDETFLDVHSFLAKYEYKMINKRMRHGKIAGTQKGMWTNGKPPFPYTYNRLTKSVEVDDSKASIYRIIIEKFLEGMSTQKLAVWLNSSNIPSPGNSVWRNQAVHRVLVDEFHLGYVISNKVKGGGHKKKGGKQQNIPPENWTKVRGFHKPLKSDEEHNKILVKLAENRRLPQKCKARVFPLSGLLYCNKCGHRMAFKQGQRQKNGSVYYTAVCPYTYPDGEKCSQRGRKLDEEFYKLLYDAVLNIDGLKEVCFETNEQHSHQRMLQVKQIELDKHKRALEKIFEGYEEQEYTKEVFIQRKHARERQISEVMQEIKALEILLNDEYKMLTEAEIKEALRLFKERWLEITSPQEQNQIISTLVERINYNREGDTVFLEIKYL
jgi:site-specific DNA recombinase